MRQIETLYQYTIKADGTSTYLQGYKEKTPIVKDYRDARTNPLVAAYMLRDLAKWALEQAEIIEELETGKPIPERAPFGNYRAVLELES